MAKRVPGRQYAVLPEWLREVSIEITASHFLRCDMRPAKAFQMSWQLVVVARDRKSNEQISIPCRVFGSQSDDPIKPHQKHIVSNTEELVRYPELCVAIYSPVRGKLWVALGRDEIQQLCGYSLPPDPLVTGNPVDLAAVVDLSIAGDAAFDGAWLWSSRGCAAIRSRMSALADSVQDSKRRIRQMAKHFTSEVTHG